MNFDYECNECKRVSRRELMRVGMFGAGMSMPFVFERASRAMAADEFATDGDKPGLPEKILVVVELAGGNDGLNTIVPFTDDAYHKARPKLAINEADLLKLDDQFGVPNTMKGFKALWDAGNVAIVPGCGYPNPNRSHFTSMEYWHTAVPNATESLGWVGRFADASWPTAPPRTIVNIAGRQSRAVQAELHAPVTFSDPNRFVRVGDPNQDPAYERIVAGKSDPENDTLGFLRHIATTAKDSSSMVRSAIRDYKTPVSYGSESSVAPLGGDLRKVSALINAGFPTRIYYVSMGGFDTHANQAGSQQSLLMYAFDAIQGFFQDIERQGRAANVAMMVFTEFGRRVAENQSGGTDHGTASPMYMIGNGIKGGYYSEYPSLTELDDNGDLVMTCDFRRVYATMIEEWIGYKDSKSILRGEFPTLGAFA